MKAFVQEGYGRLLSGRKIGLLVSRAGYVAVEPKPWYAGYLLRRAAGVWAIVTG